MVCIPLYSLSEPIMNPLVLIIRLKDNDLEPSILFFRVWRITRPLGTPYPSSAGMSNSNHCADRTLNFKTRKTYSGPQFRITKHSESILDIF